MTIIAQAIGILAMGANILSYQFKEKKHLLLLQLIASVLFAFNMFMLGAVMGGILNIVSILRASVYMYKERFESAVRYVNAGFMALYVLSYVLVFTLFGKEPTALNLLVEVLPLIGMTSMTIGFSKKSAREIRLCALINSPCWLIYNAINLSIGGILCEILGLSSAILAYLRLNRGAPSAKDTDD